MMEPLPPDEFATSLRAMSTADLVKTAAELNQQSLVLITHLMMIADEISRRESQTQGPHDVN